jgi:hypothetical protein
MLAPGVWCRAAVAAIRAGAETVERSTIARPMGWLMSVPIRTAVSSVEVGAPSTVMRLVDPPGVHPYPYDVAADGRVLAMTPPSGAAGDVTLTLMTNWESALLRAN